LTGIKTLTQMYDDIVVAIGLLIAYNIPHDLDWTLSAIENEIKEQFREWELCGIVEHGLIEEYVRFVAQGEETFTCRECSEKKHVVMECNHSDEICNACCSHADCNELKVELLSC